MDNASILIVDDKEYILNSLELILKKRYKIFKAASANEALKKLGEYKIDILITDLSMPNMNGFELIKEIKLAFPNIGILIMSGYRDKDSYEKSIHLGVYDFIDKPFNIEHLKNTIQSLLSSK